MRKGDRGSSIKKRRQNWGTSWQAGGSSIYIMDARYLFRLLRSPFFYIICNPITKYIGSRTVKHMLSGIRSGQFWTQTVRDSYPEKRYYPTSCKLSNIKPRFSFKILYFIEHAKCTWSNQTTYMIQSLSRPWKWSDHLGMCGLIPVISKLGKNKGKRDTHISH